MLLLTFCFYFRVACFNSCLLHPDVDNTIGILTVVTGFFFVYMHQAIFLIFCNVIWKIGK